MAATVPNRSRRNAWGIASLDIFSINEVLRQIQLAVDGLQVTEHEHTGTEAAESGEPDELQIVESSITPPILTSAKHNWNPGGLATATVIRVSATTPVNITGLEAQPNGTIKKFFNYGTIDITLKDNSDNSRRVNRFDLTADTVIGANETVSVQYDASSNRHRWKVIGNAGGSSAGGSLADGDKGDITVSGSGATWTIDNDAVTYAKMQNVSAASTLLGRGDGGSGDPEEITLGSNLSISGTTISATSGVTDHGALTGLTDDDHTQYPLVTTFEADRATIATRWDDLTDGGETSLHSHAGGGAEQKTPPFADGVEVTKFSDRVIGGSNITVTELADGEAVQIASTASGGGAITIETSVPAGPSDGDTIILRVGSTPFTYIRLTYDSTYGKWVSAETFIMGRSGTVNPTTTSTTYIELVQSNFLLGFIPFYKNLYDAGLRLQVMFQIVLSNSGAGDTSARFAVAEVADGDTATNIIHVGGELTHTGTTVTWKITSSWTDMSEAAVTDAHAELTIQGKVASGTGTFRSPKAVYRWVYTPA